MGKPWSNACAAPLWANAARRLFESLSRAGSRFEARLPGDGQIPGSRPCRFRSLVFHLSPWPSIPPLGLPFFLPMAFLFSHGFLIFLPMAFLFPTAFHFSRRLFTRSRKPLPLAMYCSVFRAARRAFPWISRRPRAFPCLAVANHESAFWPLSKIRARQAAPPSAPLARSPSRSGRPPSLPRPLSILASFPPPFSALARRPPKPEGGGLERQGLALAKPAWKPPSRALSPRAAPVIFSPAPWKSSGIGLPGGPEGGPGEAEMAGAERARASSFWELRAVLTMRAASHKIRACAHCRPGP